MRAMSIALLFAFGTGIGGLFAPFLFEQLVPEQVVGEEARTIIFDFSAAILMIIAALTAWRLADCEPDPGVEFTICSRRFARAGRADETRSRVSIGLLEFSAAARLVRSLRHIAAQLLDPTRSFPAGLGGLLDTHHGCSEQVRNGCVRRNRVARKPNGAVRVSESGRSGTASINIRESGSHWAAPGQARPMDTICQSV